MAFVPIASRWSTPSTLSVLTHRVLACLALAPASLPAPSVQIQELDVPLERYRDSDWPDGLAPETHGVSFLDYDGDGWVDFYVNLGAELWHNEGGLGWALGADLDSVLPASFRYGASSGDLDGDGLPDLCTEPRSGCFYLLKNQGNGGFVEIGSDPTQVQGQPCVLWAETACWADVDDDGDLDLWVPAYPFGPDGGGNRFWENLGPAGPGGAHVLRLDAEAGLELTPGRIPEGAQFCDADRDGDVDAYANGTFYQNRSSDRPDFVRLLGLDTGILDGGLNDEGVLFFDYDMDGDQDLFVLYVGRLCRLWANRGDGSFAEDADALEAPQTGAFDGCSAEDWDLDGDLDLTASSVFRRNLRMETGEPRLRLATHDIPASDLHRFVSPAWADWDQDGDVDCILDNLGFTSFLCRNTTYVASTPEVRRLSVRVRAVRDAPETERGLETEFGATVELRVHGEPEGLVRRRFVASSHGYLQQNEYALTMALPPGPDSEAPAQGVFFDLSVDFPGRPSSGLLRVDRSVNPLLGSIELAALREREITVYRSGRVVIDGIRHEPLRSVFGRRLATTGGGLALPGPGRPLLDPVQAPANDWCVGIDVDLLQADGSVRVQELVLDGQLATPIRGANVFLWEVAEGRAQLVRAEAHSTLPANHRSFLPVQWRLEPGKRYRVVCRVDALRASPLDARLPSSELRIRGGLSFQDVDPWSGRGASFAEPDLTRLYVALRYRESRGTRSVELAGDASAPR